MKGTTREDLIAWLDGLSRRLTLIAPQAVHASAALAQVLYRPVTASSEILLDFGKADLPVKEYFLPATDVLFYVTRSPERGEGGVRTREFVVEEPPPEQERVIFGLRPCDARALRILDALFIEQEPVDPYYAGRREVTTLIGLACQEMGAECFCTSLGLSPDEASDVDLMLTEVDGRYAVQAVTEKGEALLGDLILEEMSDALIREGTLPSPPSSIRAKTPILEAEAWPQHFAHAFWARLADRCLSCRLCTYVCPTCRCFDVRDDQARPGSEGIFNAEPQSRRDTPEDGGLSRESQRGEGETIQRLRAWDSCMAEGYRRIAGGHNPRPTKTERLRNRFYCKFCYYPRDFGPVACVGCGRCILKCPVNVDIAEVLERVSTW